MIESYDFGKIVIDGRRFGGDALIFPERIDGGTDDEPKLIYTGAKKCMVALHVKLPH